MLPRKHCVSVGMGLVLVSWGMAFADPAPAGAVVAAFTKAGSRPHLSPDGRYRARLLVGEGEAGVLTVYRVGHKHLPVGRPVLRRVRDVSAAIWVPRHPHTLAFGASGLYGKARLGLWDGRRLHSLRRIAHPGAEMISVYGASTDGRTLLYSQAEDTTHGIVRHNHSLRLPDGD